MIIEKAKQWKNIGYVLGIFPNGMHMLEMLHAGSEIKKKGTMLKGYTIKDAAGNTVWHMDFSGIKKKHGPMVEVERDIVHRALRKAASGIPVRLGTTIKQLKQSGDKVHVTFSDNRRDTFDIVVGADGINSQMRSIIRPKEHTDSTGFSFWVFWMPHVIKFPKNVIHYLGNGKLVGFFPTKSKKHIAVFFSFPGHVHKHGEDYHEIIAKQFADMGDTIPKVMKYLPKKPTEIFHHSDDEVHAKYWYNGRVVLLGDAVHALSPVLGMGASMALEDAFVLADELTSRKEPEKAFDSYISRRKPRVKELAKWSNEIHFLLAARTPFVTARNMFLKYMYSVSYFKKIDKFLSDPL